MITREFVENHVEIGPQKWGGTPCWNWQGKRNKDGYAYAGRTPVYKEVKTLYEGHEYVKGQIPDHKCRNKSCVNPDHIRVVNQAVNQMHQSDFYRGSMAKRRLRVAVWMHDSLVERMQEREFGE